LALKAVVVGINDYMGTINDLPSCVKDAKEFSRLLQDKLGFAKRNIREIIDSNATPEKVEEELRWLFNNAGPSDRLVFYYSGHGMTQPVNGVNEEYLCLYGGLLHDNLLSEMTQNLPPGILTVVLDDCFSGGMEKSTFQVVNAERTLVKRFKPDLKEEKKIYEDEKNISFYKSFSCSPKVSYGPYHPMCKPGEEKRASDEVDQLQLNGLLLSACLETETAAASTTRTNGLSAFTFCLLKAIDRLGIDSSSEALRKATEQELKNMNFRQTPVLKVPDNLSGIEAKSFITLENLSNGSGISERPPSVVPPSGGEIPGNLLLYINYLLRLLGLKQSAANEKLFGIDDAILIPAIISAITSIATAAIKGQQSNGGEKNSADIAAALRTTIDRQQPKNVEKLFGIDDAILIPAIASAITSIVTEAIRRQ
jgi:hypothetical protein